MSVSNGVLRSVTLAVLVGVGAIDAAAQQGGGPPAIATLRIRVTGELAPLAESGMLTFPGQGRMWSSRRSRRMRPARL